MSEVEPLNHLGLIPEPAEIQSRLAALSRAQRVLRRLLRLSLTARREVDAAAQLSVLASLSSSSKEVTRDG